VTAALQHGDPKGTVWRPAEADTSIRPGWFYHPAEDARVRSVDQLLDLYFQSVGRNSKLLLNVPPTPGGLLHETDVQRLAACRDRLRAMFETDLAAGARVSWQRTGARTAIAELDLGRTTSVTIARLEEDITKGQMVAGYTLSGSDGGEWRTLSKGTTIGYARLDRLEPAPLRRVRVTIDDAVASPEPIGIKLY
jgi:alpha-L-fucosidase